MKLTHALIGLAALGATALTTGAASAMPIGLATTADQASNIEQVRLVCNQWGRCWHAPGYYGGYGYGGYGYGHRWGYGGWRHW